MNIYFKLLLMTLAAFFLNSMAANANPEQVLKKGDRLAIVGDSITEQKIYSAYMETYLVACAPELDVKVIQLGWSGETAPGFTARMNSDLLSWKPTVVTTCFGMNDAARCTKKDYENAMRKIITNVMNSGATMVVGAPGVVDSQTFNKTKPEVAVAYNDTLDKLREIERGLAGEYKCPFADVYGVMMSAMTNAKAAYGLQYAIAGDGVHPSPNGHLPMAYAFLRTLGLDGKIGTITLNFPAKASATAGHAIENCASGAVDVASSRYPFCFTGGSNDAGTVSMLPFVPFQQDLNQFTLVVRKLPTEQAEVQWGKNTKKFSREQLEQGVNLAAEFLDNPFSKPFAEVLAAVGQKQNYDTFMVKTMFTGFRQSDLYFKDDSAFAQARETLRERLLARQMDNAVNLKKAVKPVRHRIEIRPCQNQP